MKIVKKIIFKGLIVVGGKCGFFFLSFKVLRIDENVGGKNIRSKSSFHIA